MPPSPSPPPPGCAAGYKWNSVASTCDECGSGSFCLGSKSTRQSAVPTSCGANKVTTTTTARAARECTAAPGYGWTSSGAAVQCAVGFYNPGYNTRACTRCTGGLTTAAAGSQSSQSCIAPAGYYVSATRPACP